MRTLLITTLVTAGMIAAGPASAQTVVEPVESVETIEVETIEVETAEPAVQEQAEDQPQSAWYGKPYAIDGTDVVSYRSESGPVKGSEEFTAEYDNTQWRFSSEENRDEFLSDPVKYVPEFGGYCPTTLAAGRWKVGSSKHFDIVDDKLYLSYDKKRSEVFGENAPDYIVGAKVKF